MNTSRLEWFEITKIRRKIPLLLQSGIKMKKAGNTYFDGFLDNLLLMVIFFLIVSNVMYASNNYSLWGSDAYGHFTEVPGAQSNVMSKSIGSYVVLFQRIPPSVQGSDNSTLLRFSVTQNSQDTYGVFAALIIKEKGSGNISAQFPYRFYEFGDIDFRYAFQNAVDHEVILQTRISGDPQYQNNPLTASFDVPAITGGVVGTFIQIIVILVFIALPIGIVLLIRDFNKRTKRNSSTSR